MRPADPPDDELIRRLADRAADAGLLADVETIYLAADAAVADRGAVCQRSGRCCRFRQFGHRLFVTAPEFVHFLAGFRTRAETRGTVPFLQTTRKGDSPQGVCPFQAADLCTVHAIRPLGCRTFFCQPGAELWGRPLHETLLARLKQIGQSHGLPYLYAEWTGVLAVADRCGIAEQVRTSGPQAIPADWRRRSGP